MKPDLYGILGVHRDAPIGVIRQAYRRAAKKAHPDTGGDVERFALVKLAHDVLSDEKRRARYDETGDTEGGGPDATLNNAMELAFATIQNVITEVMQRQRDPEEVDLIASAIATLKQKLCVMDEEVKGREKHIEMAKKLVKRFKNKKRKANIFTPMWTAQIAAMQDAIRVATADRPKIEMAIEILSDHEFEAKAKEAGGYQTAPFSIVDALSRAV